MIPTPTGYEMNTIPPEKKREVGGSPISLGDFFEKRREWKQIKSFPDICTRKQNLIKTFLKLPGWRICNRGEQNEVRLLRRRLHYLQ